MSKILYEVYQNDIKDSESVMYGKWYARLKSIETMSMTKLAKHISEHGSVFTEDVVEGVMKKFKTCLLEMLLESKKVKIAGLGTFYLTCECQKGGADKESDFNVNQHLKALHIRFLPDQTEEDNLSSREFIKKAEFINVKSLLSSGNTDEEGGDDENGGSSNGGSQNSGTGTVTPDNGGSQNQGGNSGSQSGNTGGNSGSQSGTEGDYRLVIYKYGNGTSTVTDDSEQVINSNDNVHSGSNVNVSVVPVDGKEPIAKVNGTRITLTENDGTYTGSFQMPTKGTVLEINSEPDEWDYADQN